MTDWQRREIWTATVFAGKSLKEMNWPETWTYDPLLRGWSQPNPKGGSDFFLSELYLVEYTRAP